MQNGRFINNFLTFIFFISINLYAQFDVFEPKTTLGGYGELHYNYSKPEDLPAQKTLDFHRFVLFYSHAWTEKWSLKAEVELEHNLVGEDNGELELEQAYVDYHHSDLIGFQAGVILPSIGLINETHEPPTFLSVERPDYHKNIIPTTWFGNGLSLYGLFSGFDYKVSVMEGLNAAKFSAGSGIRNGRQKGFKSNAEDLLYTARINYTSIPGLLAGISYTYNNATNDSTNNPVNLIEMHVRYRANDIYFDTEYANISYSDGAVKNSQGFYIDLGYNIARVIRFNGEIIPFIRFTDYNTASSTIAGGDSEAKYHISKWMIGVSYKPISEVVIKFDFSEAKTELTNSRTKFFNAGIGYMF